MLYSLYQWHNQVIEPVRAYGRAIDWFASGLALPDTYVAARHQAAFWQLIGRLRLTHKRPAYGIDEVKVDGQPVPVREEAVLTTPFGTLLRFAKDTEVEQPRVLLVAPMSGHFATLLRDTVTTLLADHDVYITDWHNARDVHLSAGRFGMDEYVEQLIRFLETIGPGNHMAAVCQPCVQALAAVAVMAAESNPAQPRSLTLMAGPVDVRINPTRVNDLANTNPIEWFERNLIARVPLPHRGAGRRVYPGFVQLTAFMSMNLGRHVRAHGELLGHMAAGRHAEAETIKDFYDEYFAVADLPAEFYLETVDQIFQRALLATGEFTYKGEKVDPRVIRRTALLTVEGERDDICALGQTQAAHDLMTGLRPHLKRHHMQAGVGHYGVFSGRRWQKQVYPVLRNMTLWAS